MVAIGLSPGSSKGKGVNTGVFLLIMAFLLGVAGAPSQPNGKIAPAKDGWDPANRPIWTLRLEDRDRLTSGNAFALQDRDADSKYARFNQSTFYWDAKDPPLWTIRPEDRRDFFASKKDAHQLKTRNINDIIPCVDKDKPATLYHTYSIMDCPPQNKFLSFSDGMMRFDTCEGWNKGTDKYKKDGCMSFCETDTTFEWAQEVPFPHSQCHYSVKCGMAETDLVNLGWNVGRNTTVNTLKALKDGISGGWDHSYGTAKGKKWDVDLMEGECGYFTFVPVKKVVCGGITEPASPPGDSGLCSSDPKNHRQCDDQLWTIKAKNANGTAHAEITDGTILFVYTDCLTRLPLSMDKQDPVYRAPGVALSPKALDAIQQGWVWNTCYLWSMGIKGQLSLYIHGSGFKDSMIGPKGQKLIDRVRSCVKASKGTMNNIEFVWYHSGYPGDDAKITGAMWVFMADVPDTIKPGCLGEAIIELGGATTDKCVGVKFKGSSS
ncbi:hypothetical protein QIS74_04611 [Colletotrichum tabaci]|uniref:Uncharacterized protein n=1 Tax=Colletotrichum tabaci TaxID=1209068 RepID=A0AAV9THR4_9PEZI